MGPPNWANRTLFHCDNLPVLRAMNSESVDLIATDPPFNKGRDFHATPDSLASGASFQDRWSWERDVHQEWVDQITDDFPRVMNVIQGSRSSYGDDMGAFLCFMAVRLLEMRRVLKSTGSLYLHCDPTASHYLKELLDAVFGKLNFKNEIIWHYRKWSTGKYAFQKNHDVILFYSRFKTRNRTFNQLYMPRAESTLKRFGTKRIVSGYDTSGHRIPSTVAGESTGVRQDDIWDVNRVAPVNQVYPTQKPIALYERIIKASSNPDDVVLDPFAGCATTCVAAEHHGRRWVGIDIWDKAHHVVIDRLKNEGLLAGPGENTGGVLQFGEIVYTADPPTRTDDGEHAAPTLRTKVKMFEPSGPKMTRDDMYKHLLSQHGVKCQGCDRTFDDPRYLELDHNTPRSDNGINHISNRILLCGPCNRLKSNTFTLTGLRRKNKKLGYMAGSGQEHPIMQEVRAAKKAAPTLFE